MSYTDTVSLLADQTEDRMIGALNRLQVGELDTDEFLAALTAILVQARSAAVGLTDVAVATELSRLWERYVAPLGITFQYDDELVVAGMVDRMAETDRFDTNTAATLGVAARAAVKGAAQAAYQAAIRDHGVKRWTRETNSGACEVCTDLADGTEMSTDTHMWSHKGCGCTPRPTE